MHTLAEMIKVRLIASVASRRALLESPSPIARATADDVPAPKPIPKLVSTIIIGKVKLRAARGSRPNWAIKKVSTALSDIVAISPQTKGNARIFNCSETRPSVRVACKGVTINVASRRTKLRSKNDVQYTSADSLSGSGNRTRQIVALPISPQHSLKRPGSL